MACTHVPCGREEAPMSTSSDVVGPRPISFTDQHGGQRSVPLSGLEIVGTKVQVRSSWTTAFDAPDLPVIAALATSRLAAGELAAPAMAPPLPAVMFKAAVAGEEGNGITVSVVTKPGPPAPTVFAATLTLNAAETDTYTGLAGAADAFKTVGVDTAPTNPGDPPLGTGLVQVVASGAKADGTPKSDTYAIKTKAVDIKAQDGTTTLFSVVPRAGYPGTEMNVVIALDPSGTTFSLTATYAPAASQDVAIDKLDTLPASLAFLVSAGDPPSGRAVPSTTSATVALTGGAPGIAASGVAFTD
jgi:hypothetical protein